MQEEPVITKARGGEYSTVKIGNTIETRWFGDDGIDRLVGRTVFALHSIAAAHIAQDKETRQ